MTTQLVGDKQLDARWSDWRDVVAFCTRLALEVARIGYWRARSGPQRRGIVR